MVYTWACDSSILSDRKYCHAGSVVNKLCATCTSLILTKRMEPHWVFGRIEPPSYIISYLFGLWGTFGFRRPIYEVQ